MNFQQQQIPHKRDRLRYLLDALPIPTTATPINSSTVILKWEAPGFGEYRFRDAPGVKRLASEFGFAYVDGTLSVADDGGIVANIRDVA